MVVGQSVNNQEEFITSPIADLLQQAGSAIACMRGGVEVFPVSEYVLQSLFLKMTGFQEQKLKCVCWELATRDYDYRYKRVLSGEVGECSSLKDKGRVCQDLVLAIKKIDHDFSFVNFRSELSLLDEMSVVYSFYEKVRRIGWLERDYKQFDDFAWCCMEGPCLCSTASDFRIFGDCTNCKNRETCPMQLNGMQIQNLASVFNAAVYKHRNRCAHNVLSQQRNRPPLADLCARQDMEENYFVRFALLIMIDKIIVCLYEKWKSVCVE